MEENIRGLIRKYVDKKWIRRLTVLRWLVNSGGKIEWDEFRQICTRKWYPLSYYVLYNQLSKDGLVFTKWLFTKNPDEKEAWAFTLIFNEIYPIVKSELERYKEEIEKMMESE